MHDNLACVTQIHTVINTLTLTIAIYYMTLLLSTWLHTYVCNNFLDIMQVSSTSNEPQEVEQPARLLSGN